MKGTYEFSYQEVYFKAVKVIELKIFVCFSVHKVKGIELHVNL